MIITRYNGKTRVSVSQLKRRITSIGYTYIVSANNLKGVVCINLARIQVFLNEKLQNHSVIFARVGKRYIINLNYIYSINVTKQKLTLSDGYLFAYRLDIAKDALKKLKDLHKQN